MGSVAAVHQLMSEDTEFDFAGLAKELPTMVPAGIKIIRSDIQPLAFGLKLLEVTTIMPDAAGLIEQLEDFYRSIDGIANVETKEVGLI
jgi:translation elongation factor aEF-1 beta